MTSTQFCYCCRVHHEQSQMRLYPTRHGYRWRCVRSIEAAAASLREREAFGKKQSALNREAAREAAERGAQIRRSLMASGG